MSYKDKRSNPTSHNLIEVIWARDDPDDVMETSYLTIDYDKQWLNCVSAISHRCLYLKTPINKFSLVLFFKFFKNPTFLGWPVDVLLPIRESKV